MDFLEGFCLGPIWTDTDYNERRHSLCYLILGFLMILLVALCLVRPSLSSTLLLDYRWTNLTIALLLFIALPFAAAYYHRIPRPWRYLILLGYIVQYWCFVAFMVQTLVLQLTPRQADLSSFFLDQINNMINNGVNFFAFLGGLTGNLSGIMGSALLLSFLFILFLFALLLVPVLYLILVKNLQRLWDRLVIRQFFAKRLRF